MSTEIDNQVVAMKFDNGRFEQGVSTTLGTLDKLKSALRFDGSKKGMQDLQNTASRFNMGGMASSVQGVSKSFLALSTVAITALSNITNRAVDAGLNLAKSLTLEPIMDGFREYETQMGAIQTILSNTKDKGSDLDDVSAALDQLNTYADKTIYNFTEMTRNIGTFTAAGVDLNTSVQSIKGIANLAAISGSTSQQASTAMYQLSQALAAGRVNLQDWNSVVNAGMGGAVFQKALVRTAQNMGTISKNAVGVSGQMKTLTINGESFRESISARPGEKSWLTSDVLTNTLKQLSGEMTEAQLKAEGFSDAQAKAIVAMGKDGEAAATEVKTLTQLLDTMKEAVGSGWAQTWKVVFGDFEEAKSLFTGVSNFFGDFIGAQADARNEMLQSWSDMGGREVLIDGLKEAFQALLSVLKPIKEAFRDIFPRMTAERLYDLTEAFRDFMANFRLSGETADNLKRTFRGFFALLSIGRTVLKTVAKAIFGLTGNLLGGENGILNFTGSIGDFLVSLDKSLKQGNAFTAFFDGLGKAITVPMDLIRAITKGIAEFGQKLIDFVGSMASNIGEALGSGQWDGILDGVRTGLLGGLLLLLRKFVKDGVTLGLDLTGGFTDNIKEALGALTGQLKAMQTSIQANTILKIAGAIAALAGAAFVLSKIDGDKLAKSLSAMAIMFSQLLLSMAVLTKISSSGGFIAIPLIASSMVLLSGAVVTLALAVKLMSGMSWSELAKGLTGVAGILASIAGTAKLLKGSAAGLILAGPGIMAMAIGIRFMASAVVKMAELSWVGIAKGLVTLTGSLIAIAGAVKLMPLTLPLIGAGLMAVGAGIGGIADALLVLSGIDGEGIGKAMFAMGSSLLVIAGALYAFPPHVIAIGVGLMFVSTALKSIATAVGMMGGLSWPEIARGLVGLGGALLVLAGGLYLMSGTLAGAAALFVAANGVAILGSSLKTLGKLSWGEIVKGLVAFAGILGTVGAAALLLTPAIPGLLALGLAMAGIGSGIALMGIGIKALADGFATLIDILGGGMGQITAVLSTVQQAVANFLQGFGQGLVLMAGAIVQGAPKIAAAFASILGGFLTAVIQNTPLIVQAMGTLLTGLLQVIVQNAPKILNAALQLMIGFIETLADNIGPVTDVAVDLITKFMLAIGDNAGDLMEAGADLIIDLINSLAETIDHRSDDLGRAGGRLARALLTGMAKGLAGFADELLGPIDEMVGWTVDKIKSGFGIFSPSRVMAGLGVELPAGLGKGMAKGLPAIRRASDKLVNYTIAGLRDGLAKAGDIAMDGIDVNPTITPVLDLTRLQADATRIDGLLRTPPLSTSLASTQAGSIATSRIDEQAAAQQAAVAEPAVKEIKLEQNNYSPKALSTIDIYRNTRNQLSMVKEALGVDD